MKQFILKFYFAESIEVPDTKYQSFICHEVYASNFECAVELAKRLQKVYSADHYSVEKFS